MRKDWCVDLRSWSGKVASELSAEDGGATGER